jgi:hypothetical protein
VVIAAADIERMSLSRQRLGIRSIGEPMQEIGIGKDGHNASPHDTSSSSSG